MELTRKEYERGIEMMYWQVYQHLTKTIPSDKLFVYLDAFCRAFEIDYTSISLASTTFLTRIKPTIAEETIFVIKAEGTLSRLGYDYRTIRKDRKVMESGKMELYPRISNRFILEDMAKFIKSYLSLHPTTDNYWVEFYENGGLERPKEAI